MDYILPIASQTTLGGIKIGAGLTILDNGTVNVTNNPVADGSYQDIIVSSNGTIYTIASNVVTNAKLYQMPAGTIKANITGAPAQPTDVTLSQLTSNLSVFTGDSGSGGVKGLVPAPAAGDAAANKYLKANGQWVTLPAGTGAVWGGITGSLAAQTDLYNYLLSLVPYTGATTNVNLGEYELKAGQFTLDTSPTGVAAVGTTRWNDTIGSSETTLKGGNVLLKNGVDLVARVVNKVTPNTTLTKAAYQAVRISGAQGQRLAVSLAQANNDNNSADTIGLAIETIAPNQEGFIMTVGQLEGINTTGSLQGETWADGNVIYLSPTVAGRLTNIKPVAPQHVVIIGYIEYAHATNGKMYVKIMNGWELGELHDVNTTGAANGQVLKYNGTIWGPSSDLGITSLNGLGAASQSFSTGSTGTDFNISSTSNTHIFNIPTASATNRGLLSSSDWGSFTNKSNATELLQVITNHPENSVACDKIFLADANSGGFDITPNPLLALTRRTMTVIKTDKSTNQVKVYPTTGCKFNNGLTNDPLILANQFDTATIYFDQLGLSVINYTLQHFPLKTKLSASGSFKVPNGYMIQNIIAREITGTAIDIKFGTTLGGSQVIASLSLATTDPVYVTDADLVKRIFNTVATPGDQIIYVDEILGSWPSGAEVQLSVELKQIM